MTSRGPDWDYYQCKCGNILFEYNTVTGERFMSETWSRCTETCMTPVTHMPTNTSPFPSMPIGPPKQTVSTGTETDEVETGSCKCTSNTVDQSHHCPEKSDQSGSQTEAISDQSANGEQTLDQSAAESEQKTDQSAAKCEQKMAQSAAENKQKTDQSAAENKQKTDQSAAECEQKMDQSAAECEQKIDQSASECEQKIDESAAESEQTMDQSAVECTQKTGQSALEDVKSSPKESNGFPVDKGLTKTEDLKPANYLPFDAILDEKDNFNDETHEAKGPDDEPVVSMETNKNSMVKSSKKSIENASAKVFVAKANENIETIAMETIENEKKPLATVDIETETKNNEEEVVKEQEEKETNMEDGNGNENIESVYEKEKDKNDTKQSEYEEKTEDQDEKDCNDTSMVEESEPKDDIKLKTNSHSKHTRALSQSKKQSLQQSPGRTRKRKSYTDEDTEIRSPVTRSRSQRRSPRLNVTKKRKTR